MNKGEILQQWLKNKLEEYRNPYHMATDNGWSSGLVYNGLKGIYSETLWHDIGLRLWPKREGIFISCSPEMKARFDAQRGESSRQEYLEELLELGRGY